MASLILEPAQGVSLSSGEFVAEALPAWLRIPNFFDICGRHWFHLRYASSFFDRPVRPLLNFRTEQGEDITYILNGPVLGTAEWIGRVPDDAVSVSISTTDRLGPFALRFDKAHAISKYALAGRHFGAAMARSGRLATSWRSDPWQFEIDLYKIANRATPMAKYAQWIRRLQRLPELHGIDRPRSDWEKGPIFSLLMTIDEDTTPKSIQATIKSLQQQPYHRWTLTSSMAGGVSDNTSRSYRSIAANDARLRDIDAPLFGQTDEAADWFAFMSPGDTLESIALGAIAEEIARQPNARFIYSDEDAADEQGRPASPRLKPDWSATFQDNTNYIGRLACVRKDALPSLDASPLRILAANEKNTLRDVMSGLSEGNIVHLRRILCRRENASTKTIEINTSAKSDAASPVDATIIVVTKDRPDLLSECLRGLQHHTDHTSFNVIVVDNGTTDDEALRLLALLQSDPRFTVLQRPGPFNFSALCNEGARLSTAQVLVFLNNDIEIRDKKWLARLTHAAAQEHVGVVGATLLYPNGRLQHAGVTLGLGSVTGHIYSGAPNHGTGYLHHLSADREVSAVTAACCAIERAKFERLGGFDALNLPVEFSDIDLCLRAREQGWSNICLSGPILVHHESASRGVAPSAAYEAERRYFLRRWRQVLRDDPFFHPALSMFALQPSLA